MTRAMEVVAEGLTIAEGLRWRGDRLWFSDIHDLTVKRLDPSSGTIEVMATVEGRPCGLGWDAEGRLLVAAMQSRQVLRVEHDGATIVLANLDVVSDANDMVVDTTGEHCFVGTIGFDLFAGEAPRTGEILRIGHDGACAVVADDIAFANGMVITPDQSTLVVAESFGGRLTAFDLGPGGTLSGRRTWGGLEGSPPDGICLDAEGCIWAASPLTSEVVRVAEGGEVLDRVPVDVGMAITCTLGGTDGRTLYVSTAQTVDPAECARRRDARIEAIEVDVAGSGSP